MSDATNNRFYREKAMTNAKPTVGDYEEAAEQARDLLEETGLTPRQLADALAESQREATRFFEEAETANARMRQWEKHVYIADPFPMLHSVSAGEHGDTPLPIPVPKRVIDLLDTLAESERRRKELVKALEKLARLGGIAGAYGNSEGNMIALAALASNANPQPE